MTAAARVETAPVMPKKGIGKKATVHVLPSVPMPTNADELARCLADPMWRITSGALYKIMIKGDDQDDDVTVLPFKPNRAQRRFIKRLWHRNIILKARQLGFTTLIAILWLDHALFNANQRVGIVAQNREAAEAIFRDKVKFAYENMPAALREAMPIRTSNASEILFDHNNSSVRVATSMRGGTPHRLHVSEFGKICAEFPLKANEIVTGTLPAVPKTGIVVIESTAEGREGSFFKMSQKAQGLHEQRKILTLRDYRFHFYPWWQAPEYRMPPAGVLITQADHEYFMKVEADMATTLDIEQRAWYCATRDADFAGEDEKMWQEYPSTPAEAFQRSTQGTYYAIQLARARKEGRIGIVPHDPRVPVNTFWDLGLSDKMAIWLHQRVGLQDRFLGYYENSGEPLAHYTKWLNDWAAPRQANWGKHHLPHDGAKRNPGGQVLETYEDMLTNLGFRDIEIVERIDDVTRGIQMTRDKFHTAWIDEEGCKQGLIHLETYKKEWNRRLGVWSDYPRHDDASNGSDAFRQWAQGYNPDNSYKKLPNRGSWRTA